MSEKKSLWDKVPFLQKLKNIKHIEIIIIAIFFVVLAIIFFSNKGEKKSEIVVSEYLSVEQYRQQLEDKLENVLSKIDGAGNVSVMITLNGGISYEYATESEEVTTSSSLSNGTNSKTTVTEKVVIVSINGKSTPLVVKEIYPEVLGVVVVCSGGGNVSVRLNVLSAVQTLLKVSDSNVEILAGIKTK